MTSLAIASENDKDVPEWLLKLKDPTEPLLPICAQIEHCIDDYKGAVVENGCFDINKHLKEATVQLLSRNLSEPGSPDVLVGTLKAVLGHVSEILLHFRVAKDHTASAPLNVGENDPNTKQASTGVKPETVDQFFVLIESVTAVSSVFNMKYGKDKTLCKETDGNEVSSDMEDSDGSNAETDDEEDFIFDPEWRAKIGFADWIDFLDERKQKWSRAQIIEENPVEFKYKIQAEGTSAYLAEWVEIFSERIAPDGMHTRKQKAALKKFQKKLRIGDRVDAQTTLKSWRSGCIVDIVDDSSNEKASAEYLSKCLIRFDGFTEISDEWVERFGTRLEPVHTHTQKTHNFSSNNNWDSGMLGGTNLCKDVPADPEEDFFSKRRR